MSAASLDVRSPRDGHVFATVPVFGAEQLRATVVRGQAAQRRWWRLGPRERAEALGALALVLDRRGDEIADRIVLETGKPRVEALAEVAVSVELLRYYEQEAPSHLRRRSVGAGWLAWKSAWIEREPYGVVGAITPWNYPFLLVMDCVSPALATGNAVVVKPSEYTPWSPLLLPELVREAGLPEGLVQVATGDGGTGAALLGSGIDRLVFTGSTATGRKVMAAAAEHLVPITLELGGKDPALVLADADLDRAAAGIAYGAFFNAGQTCISVERAYVVDAVYDEFLEKITGQVGALRATEGADGEIGPLVNEPQLRVVREQVAAALAGGARAVVGGPDAPAPDGGYAPTVLVDCKPEMAVLSEETFGPVLPIVRVANEEDAVAAANAGSYGLCASVWTRDRKRGIRIARRLRAGGVSVNDVLSHYAVPGLPLGGVGSSGFGRRRGLEALDEMSRPRTIFVDRLGLRREPWWFPYSALSERLFRALLDMRGRGGLRGVVAAGRRLVRRKR